MISTIDNMRSVESAQFANGQAVDLSKEYIGICQNIYGTAPPGMLSGCQDTSTG